MGVPAFYRWLSQKYPKIVKDVIEEHPEWIDGVEVPVDTSTPNPNGMEFDNLYLDMNGIIHPCFHPEDRPAPTTETEVFQNIFDYIDRLFSIVRPRKLLYMAIDGVAPRAKMNQQRSRRFRAAQDAEERAKEEARILEELAAQGIKFPKVAKSDVFDSNIITPGTEFMDRLATALQYYVHLRLSGDKGWRDIEVILSDSNVPGEGEHKAMQYIRQMRGRPGWNPNTYHCMYGLDADLIMLALATHEPHFCILREVIIQQAHNKEQSLQETLAAATQAATDGSNPQSLAEAKAQNSRKSKAEVAKKPYQLLMVSILREYLAMEMKSDELSFEYDPERVFDDFVFMCFFVGNDFLPHMPTLDIREGAIELMMRVYKQNLARLGGYLTDGYHINWSRAEQFIQTVGQYEDAIFQKRMRELRRQRDRLARNKQQQRQNDARRNAAGQRTRADEAAPSAEFFKRAMDSGDVRAARQGGPRGWTVKGDAPPSQYTAAGMDAEIKALEAAQGGAGVEGPLPRPPAAGATGSPLDNQSAAAKLRARMIATKRTRPDDDGDGGDEQQEGEQVGGPDGAAAAGGGQTNGSDAKRVKGEDGEAKAVSGGGPETAEDPSRDEDMVPAVEPVAVEGETVEPVAVEGEPCEGVVEGSALEEEEEEEEGDAEEEELEEVKVDVLPLEPVLDELSPEEVEKNKQAAAKVKEQLEQTMKDRGDKFESMFSEETEKIRLDEAGWKTRYYEEKMGTPPDEQPALVRSIVKEYVRGLAWVMAYYYKGCASWNWYYPYHYAPFASDLTDLSGIDTSFDLGEPFTPFNQLMGVLPAASAHALPQAFRWLFTDKESPILDFYPKDFQVDMNGKRFAWQGVALLPFIEQDRLLAATEQCLEGLSDEEKRRNSRRMELLYVSSAHSLAPGIYELEATYGHITDLTARAQQALAEISPDTGKGMSGYMLLGPGEVCPPSLPAPFGLGQDITGNSVLCVNFKLPPELPHVSKIMPGTEVPTPILNELDMPIEETLWHEKIGGGGPRHDGRGPRGPHIGDAGLRHISYAMGGGGHGGRGPYDSYGQGGGGYGGSGGGYGGGPRGGYNGGGGYGERGGYYDQGRGGYPDQRGAYYEQRGGYGGGRGGYSEPPQRGGYGGGYPPARDPRGGYSSSQPPANPYAHYTQNSGYGSGGGYPPPNDRYGGSGGGRWEQHGYGAPAAPPAAPAGRGGSFYSSMRPAAPGAAHMRPAPPQFGARPPGGPPAYAAYGAQPPMGYSGYPQGGGGYSGGSYAAPAQGYQAAAGAAPPQGRGRGAPGGAPYASNNPFSALQRPPSQQRR